eukprot:m51a1_g7084 putative vacuolar atp synthase subunit h (492) ;mRNA; f:11535-14137
MAPLPPRTAPSDHQRETEQPKEHKQHKHKEHQHQHKMKGDKSGAGAAATAVAAEEEAAPVSLDEPVRREEVLGRAIPWDNLRAAGLLYQDELDLVKQYDKKDAASKRSLLDERGAQFLGLFVGLMKRVTTTETLQYLAALANEAFELDAERRVAALPGIERVVDLYTPCINILKRSESDWFLNKEVSLFLTRLFLKGSAAPADAREQYFAWVAQQLSRTGVADVRVGLGSLQRLLSSAQHREIFVQRSDGLNLLQRLLEGHMQISMYQVLYEAIYCVWLCTYLPQAAQAPPAGLVLALCEALKQIAKEKVQRIALMALRNMAGAKENRQRMVAGHLQRTLPIMLQRKWGDSDITDDLEFLDKAVQDEVLAMSSWEIYASELTAGAFEWTPVHKSEKFWRENAQQFEQNQFQPLGRLHEILKSSTDRLCLAVACHDVGEFVRFHPRGRTLLNQMDIKVELMKLMLHDDADVRKEALFALQKLMAHKVEYSGV